MSHKSFSQFFLEDAATYQAIAMPSVGFGQNNFGQKSNKSITGGIYNVTNIGATSTENEESKYNRRKKSHKRKNKYNRVGKKRI